MQAPVGTPTVRQACPLRVRAGWCEGHQQGERVLRPNLALGLERCPFRGTRQGALKCAAAGPKRVMRRRRGQAYGEKRWKPRGPCSGL
jgi:hypothetical protein